MMFMIIIIDCLSHQLCHHGKVDDADADDDDLDGGEDVDDIIIK